MSALLPRYGLALVVILAGFAGTSARAATITSTFDTGLDGWTGVDGIVTWQPAGGNPGGYLEETDANDQSMLVVAPAAFLGDLSGFLGGTFGFDARNINGDSPDFDGFGQVTLFGSGGSVTAVLGGLGQPPVGGGWVHYEAELTTAVWGAGLSAVLADVTGIQIVLESHNGVSEVNGLDNVQLVSPQVVPEPATWASALLGAGLLGLARRVGRPR